MEPDPACRPATGSVICQGRSKSRPLWGSKSRPVADCEVVEYFVGKGLWSVAEEALPHEARAGGVI